MATCTVWLAVDASTRQNGCLQVIAGSHRDQRLRKHNSTDATDVNLNQELDASEYDEARARYIELEPGQISLHDVYLLHGADANVSPQSRRGMTMRFMPTTSHFDRALASAKSRAMNITDHAERPVYLMRGIDRCGKNRFINA
ncbi:MAG: phytanoyl-CoA dioxygenase family protein [Burkholderiaceae bacterium]